MTAPPAAPPPYVPQPPQQKSHWWKILIVVGAVVALLCCIGAVTLGIWGYNKAKDVAGPVQTASAYLDDVQDGNYGQAYDRLCANAKNQLTPQQFSQAQSMLPKITDHKITGFDIKSVNGRSTASVRVTLEREMIGETQQTMQLVKEDDDWKVCQVGV